MSQEEAASGAEHATIPGSINDADKPGKTGYIHWGSIRDKQVMCGGTLPAVEDVKPNNSHFISLFCQ